MKCVGITTNPGISLTVFTCAALTCTALVCAGAMADRAALLIDVTQDA